MTKIGWDSDGVLYRFTKAYHLWMNSDRGTDFDVEVEPLKFDWFLDWQSMDDFFACMDASVDARKLFWEGDLYEEGLPELFHTLKRLGHTNHLITHRFSGKTLCSQAATRYFYESKGIYFDSLTFSHDKTVVKVDVFLEDNVKNYDQLEEAGIEAYLINRPYNQVLGDTRRRVDSIYEFVEKVT